MERDVALKILPESFAADPRLARTEVLASLNHQVIAAIYGLERLRPSRAEARDAGGVEWALGPHGTESAVSGGQGPPE